LGAVASRAAVPRQFRLVARGGVRAGPSSGRFRVIRPNRSSDRPTRAEPDERVMSSAAHSASAGGRSCASRPMARRSQGRGSTRRSELAFERWYSNL